MELEAPPPNLGLVGKTLTERAGTDIIAKFLGHEMRIISPIWIPESWKNKIVDRMRSKFQRAFPGIDFSRVSSKELDNIGFQTVFAETQEESEKKHERPGIALIESMTQIIATYAHLYGKGKPVALEDLQRSGLAYFGSTNVDRITKSLLTGVWHHHARHINGLPPYAGAKTDQFTHEAAQTIARALFTGNYDELKKIFAEKPQGKSFDAFLQLPIDDLQNQEASRKDTSTDKSRTGGTGIKWNTIGMYTEDTSRHQAAIVYNMAGSSYVSIMRPIVDILGKILPKGLKIRYSHDHDWYRVKDAMRATSMFIRTIDLHEFAHFFSFRMWRKQPLESLDPSLRKFVRSPHRSPLPE